MLVLQKNLLAQFKEKIISLDSLHDQITLEIDRKQLIEVCLQLRDEEGFQFNQLMDICGVDYQSYGSSDWETESTTLTGFDRGVEKGIERKVQWNKPRFAVIYHLLSTLVNQRLRLRVFVDEKEMSLDSVTPIWSAADWFEREAFDLFGLVFKNHPDLRRILTDYGFMGHPFRKDFPLIGQVEVRYDAEQGRVVYEPVSLAPRTLVPKTIR